MPKIQEIKLISALTRPHILFYTIPWLIFILFIGTLQQRYIGLYEAEKQYFASFFIWFKAVPLPGMYIILSLIGLSLIAKLVIKSPWRAANAGTIITHMGALLLLFGALLTALASEEGAITLGKGEQASEVVDYHARELAVLKNDALLFAVPYKKLSQGQIIADKRVPFSLEIQDFCRHCAPAARRFVNPAHRGIAEKVELHTALLNKEDEANQFGITFKLSEAGEAHNGIYVTMDGALHQPVITLGQDTYHIVARKSRRPLPFTVQLESFQTYTYPGSNIAEEYESIVTIIDGELSWQSPIRMNEPLRYKGYTLYQSSFIGEGEEQLSVLAVVKNAGRAFPYIASIVMCLGLLIHLIYRARAKTRSSSRRRA